jgi:hypothetical protein
LRLFLSSSSYVHLAKRKKLHISKGQLQSHTGICFLLLQACSKNSQLPSHLVSILVPSQHSCQRLCTNNALCRFFSLYW